jgi:6-phosphogluconolactonase
MWRNPPAERRHENTGQAARVSAFHRGIDRQTRTGDRRVNIEVYPDSDAVAHRAAAVIGADLRAAVTSRARYVMAVSGGHTPWAMLRVLAKQQLPWEQVHIVQTDERVASAADPDRNLVHLRKGLLDDAPLRADHIHAMPVETSDLDRAAQQYTMTLMDIAGSPPVLDLVHLGLGPDGHTASLVPGDPILDVADADVAVTVPYQGRRRMTLTFPIINRSRLIVWLVTGHEKAEALVRLRDGDPSIPASRVRRDRALIFADRVAAERLGTNEKLEAQK